MTLGEKMKALRLQQGLTLEEVGERVGVGKSTVRKWESGQIANMRRDKIALVAKALGTTPDYLMGWAFPQRLNNAIVYRKMTYSNVAELTGMSTEDIDRMMAGDLEPTPEIVAKLAEVLGVTKESLEGLTKADIVEASAPKHPLPSNLRPMDQLHRQRVQLIRKVAAGQPIMAETDYETFVDAPVDCDAALEVQGYSMTPTYLPGDIVYIKHRPDVENGQVAVVLLDDSATLKHVYHDPDGLTLISDNPAYAPIRAHSDEYTYIAIYGIPVGYTRIYRKDPLRMIHKGLK